ncbi:uncharacterized protein LOC110920094 [Helianthus annuus]|uniref:uncharacterized protein LOC110920094 n=1 Tax=Helianthus annuus TaxID=4232 RepID=UPI000B8F2541|nr:uncharacterized protein LOC110920094 [Helianthus annuus]
MTPKDLGGLGMGSLREANVAMLSKWWWRFKVDQQSLWRKVVWSIHAASRSWNYIPVKLSLAGPWKQLGKIGEDLMKADIDVQKLIKVRPGVGSKVCFWTDWWTVDEPLCRKFPELFGLERKKQVTVEERYGTTNGETYLTFDWTRQPSSDTETNELATLFGMIAGFNSLSGTDIWEWSLESSGIFSVRSIKRRLQVATFEDLGNGFQWNKLVPIKVNFLAWRLSLNRLPTVDNLEARGLQVGSSMCSFCGLQRETAEHLFVSCRLSQVVWDFVATWCKLYGFFMFGVTDLISYYKKARGSEKWRSLVYLVIQTAVWCIWRSRNEAIFRRKQPTLERIKNEITAMGYLWYKSRSKLANLTWEKWCNFDLVSMAV